MQCMIVAAVFNVAFAEVKANQCPSGGECPGSNKPNNVVSMLQTNLQMDVIKDEGGEQMAAAQKGGGRQRRALSRRHSPNDPQLRYELLRDFTKYMALNGDLRWILGAGSLLGAMRQDPPGFIQGDDDIDIYMPARDLYQLFDRIQSLPKSSGFLDSPLGVAEGCQPESCCGFGYRLHHRKESCAYMDLMVLSLQAQPFTDHFVPTPEGKKVWAIPRDRGLNRADTMMLHREKWEKTDSGEWEWLGNATSSFPGHYIFEDELFPLQQMQMYELTVNIPKQPRSINVRSYGITCYDSDNKGHNLNLSPEWRKPAYVNITLG